MELDGARVYFGPCGIGLGHVSRMLPIAQEVRRMGAEVLFSTYLEGMDYVRRLGFPVAAAPPISMSNDPSGSVDLRMSTINHGIRAFPTFTAQVRAELRYMKAFRPDIVVSDSRLSTITAGKLLDLPVVLTLNQFLPIIPRQRDRFMLFKIADGVVMTIVGRGWGLSDRILIPDFPAPYTLSIDTLRIPKAYVDKVELVGAILPKKPSEAMDRMEVRRELGVGKSQKLVYAGISGPTAERLPLLRFLQPIFTAFPDDYRVIMSMGDPASGNEPIEEGALLKIPWVEDRFDVLNACDLVVSRGGHETLMQSICYGKPSIIIPVPNHPEQYGNARRAQALGVSRAIHQRNVSKDEMILLAGELIDNREVRAHLREMEALGLGDGVEKSVKNITSLLPAHRKP